MFYSAARLFGYRLWIYMVLFALLAMRITILAGSFEIVRTWTELGGALKTWEPSLGSTEAKTNQNTDEEGLTASSCG